MSALAPYRCCHCDCPALSLYSVNSFYPCNLLFLHLNPSLPLTVPFWFRANRPLISGSGRSRNLCSALSDKFGHVQTCPRVSQKVYFAKARTTTPPPFLLGPVFQAVGHKFVLSKLQYLHIVCASDLPSVQLLILILKFLSARLQSKRQGTDMNK